MEGNRIQWKRNIRIFLFIGVFLLVESFKLAYRFRVTARTEETYVPNAMHACVLSVVCLFRLVDFVNVFADSRR